MASLILGAVALSTAIAIGVILSGPTKENETVAKIRRHHEYQAGLADEERERKRCAAKLEESRRRLQAVEVERKWKEEDMKRARARAAVLERNRVKAEQDAAAERARAAEAEKKRQDSEAVDAWIKASREAREAEAEKKRQDSEAVGAWINASREAREAREAAVQYSDAERTRQEREPLRARALAARDAREAREAAANYERMRVEREAAEERSRLRAEHQKAIAEKKATEEEARRKEEDARIALHKLGRETRELTRRLRDLEIMEKEQKEAKEKRDKEKQEAGGGGGGVFGPLRWPSREEFHDAMQRTQYDRNNFHFAIVGRAGSGKSSLINAFRNLRNKGPGAAKAGTTETTLEIGRYPDPGTTPPRQWMVWYDVPGAGTQRIPHHNYFVRQGLFVFDLVVLVIGDRFEEIDVRIVEDCARFQIPTFIVRSKADMHILNSMKEYGDYTRAEDNPALYAKCRDEFIFETQRTVSEGLARQKLPDQEVYIISRDVLQRTYNGTLQRLRSPDWAQTDGEVIHEARLSKQLIDAAAGRRCETGSGGGGGGGRGADGSRGPAQTSVTNAINWVKDTVRDAVVGFADGNSNSNIGARTGSGPSNPTRAHQVNQQRGPAPPSTPAGQNQTAQNKRAENKTAPAANECKPVQQAHAAKEPPQRVLKMIYPREPTDSPKLFAEMVNNNPEIENMLVCKPRMFTPKAALLTFYPLAPVPRVVAAFGGTLRIKDYEVRERKGGGEKKGGEENKGGEEKKGGTAAAAGQNPVRILPTFGDGAPESMGSLDSSTSEMNAKRGRMRKGKGRGGY